MGRTRESVYRAPARKTWQIEADAKTQVVVTRTDGSSLWIWTPELGLGNEGIEIRLNSLDAFCQAVAEAHSWTDEAPGTTEV